MSPADVKRMTITRITIPQCAVCQGRPTHSIVYQQPSVPGPSHTEFSCDNCLIDVVKLTLTKVKLGVD